MAIFRQLAKGPRWVAAWLCLLAHLLAASPLPALGSALVAWLDGEHEVSLGGANGQLAVRLQHSSHRAGMEQGHRHSPLCRALCALETRTDRPESDHVLAFAAADETVPDEGWDSAPQPDTDTAAAAPSGANLLRSHACWSGGEAGFGTRIFTEPISRQIARTAVLRI